MNRKPTHDRRPDIAVIGMAASLPGAGDLEEFWANIREGKESITHGSPRVVEDPASGQRWVHARGVLDDVKRFDAEFFGIPRREAEVLDPQHRRLLEIAWNAMEDAGYDPYRVREDVAVYTSAGPNTYYAGRDFGARSAAERMLIQLSNGPDTLPTRVSYKLGLTGESVNVQSACSSAAVAVHLACEALRDGRTDMALVGAVSISASGSLAYEHQDGFILSADGSTRAYDSGASGYVESDGVGAFVLRRLDDALARNDNIHAVIKGSAANNDGRAKAGFSAPSVEGQARVIRAALEASGVSAESIGMVEGHGTGTQVGDPIEVRGLTRAYQSFTRKTGYCVLGSVKANIGHLCFASGVAGLLKAILCLKHGELPPMAVLKEINPEIDFSATPFYINRELKLWPDEPRRAGVSSFGMGGTNVHFILEQAPEVPEVPTATGADSDTALPVVLSGRTEQALRAVKQRLHAFLGAHPDVNLADLAYTLATGRRPLDLRWAAAVDSTEELRRALEGTADTPVFDSAGQGGSEAEAALGQDDSQGSPAAVLAREWAGGKDIEWAEYFGDAGRRRISLPLYPWQGEQLWVEAAPCEDPAKDGVLLEAEHQAPVDEWLYRPTWERTSLPRPYHIGDLSGTDGACLVLGGDGELTRSLAEEFTKAGLTTVRVVTGERFEARGDRLAAVRPGNADDMASLVEWATAEAGPIRKVVHLWSCEEAADQDSGIRLGTLSMLHLVQALTAARQSSDLWIVTENAQSAQDNNRTLRLEASALLGLARVIPQEHPELRCHCVDFAQGTGHLDVVPRLLAEMASPSDELEVVYRGADRLALTVEPVPAKQGTPVAPRPGGVYLITGGLGRIGLTIAEHLARAAPVRLALISRRASADAAEVQRLTTLGAEVLVLAADVADESGMRRAVAEIHARWGAINGVVHSAGIEESRNFSFISETTTERALEALRPKVPGIAVLDAVTRAEPLDFCLVCSSLDTLLGGIAFGIYSTANRYLDSYAHWRRAHGAPWVSVDWDSWRFGEEGAARIGAAAARTAIRPEQAGDILSSVLAAQEPQCVVSTVPLTERIERIRRSFSRRQEEDRARAGGRGEHTRESVGETVRTAVGEITDTSGLRDTDELLAVGCDSLALLEVVVRLESALQLKLPVADLWGCTTIGDLAEVCWGITSAQRSGDGDAAEEALRYLAG
ncbi:SDR family NAD(P)-dependent oxidoreductase [Streptomyces sp. NPDC006251]|uniref:SDR family NAD(P)-dependent oxidoreductase n=1 Tax=Streptomyces sp. NPDC006251 TaxID=3155718 RepID=UPI0033ADC623